MKYSLRFLAYPCILGLILIKYNYHAIRNSIFFLMYGGEWVTFAKEDKVTMQMIYDELKKQSTKQSEE